jgi:hypothetical protein
MRIQIRKLLFPLLTSALLAAAASVQGATITISFEAYPGPDGKLGTSDDIAVPDCPSFICPAGWGNNFATMGITFAGPLVQSPWFPGSGSSNHYIYEAMDAGFSFPVNGISVLSYSYWSVAIYALDSSHNVIATNTLANPNSGSAPLLGTLSLSTVQPISEVWVLPSGCSIGGSESACDGILNLDNLVLTTPDGTTTPEPSTVLPICAALSLALVRRKAGWRI